jgi:uncharacterized membrane protein YcaP (DUF421 family)
VAARREPRPRRRPRNPGSQVVRRILRGEPRALVRDGQILQDALERERMSRNDLLAGLRKQGYASSEDVQLAVLKETGHLSAVPRDDPGHVRRVT